MSSGLAAKNVVDPPNCRRSRSAGSASVPSSGDTAAATHLFAAVDSSDSDSEDEDEAVEKVIEKLKGSRPGFAGHVKPSKNLISPELLALLLATEAVQN